MATTLLELRTRLRRYLGEPYEAGQSSLDGTWRDSELNDDINEAMRVVVSECVTFDKKSLIQKVYPIRVEQNVREYLLPSDLSEILFVEFVSGGSRYILPQAPSLPSMIDGLVSSLTTSIPYGFQILPSRRYVITEGIATSGSGTTLVDSDRAGSSEHKFSNGTKVVDEKGNPLSVGDIVENVTDDSEAVITSISDTTITFSSLSGGSRNNFELGDYYRVLQKEATRYYLYLYPPSSETKDQLLVSFDSSADASYGVGNVEGINQKVAQSFRLNRDAVVSSICVRFGKNVGSPLGNVVLRVETNGANVPSGVLSDFSAKASLPYPVENEWNTFTFKNPFRLSSNTVYWIVLEIPTQSNYYSNPVNNYHSWMYKSSGGYAEGNAATHNGTSWVSQPNSDMLFSIRSYLAQEAMYVHYSALPQTLVNNNDILEIPYKAEEAIIRYATFLALRKKEPVGVEVANAYRMYLEAIDQLKIWVKRREEQGYGVIRNVLPLGRGYGLSSVRSTADPARFSLPRKFQQ